MIEYPNIDPIALSIGPVDIRWYGLAYLAGFLGAYLLCARRARMPNSGWNTEQVSDMVFYGAMGAVLGGRVGYMLFYNFGALLDNPLQLFAVWQGGMSFHGGLLGVIIAMFLFARKTQKNPIDILDFGAPAVPIGLATGRLANFIGGELWGRTSDVPWAMVFPGAGDLPRHPSQLYEAFFEGLVLLAILYWFSRKPRPRMAVSGLFLLGYGVFRFFIEFTRQPDEHLGTILAWMTMGQILCVPMILGGVALMVWAYKQQVYPPRETIVEASKSTNESSENGAKGNSGQSKETNAQLKSTTAGKNNKKSKKAGANKKPRK